jgi:hypothetical protein
MACLQSQTRGSICPVAVIILLSSTSQAANQEVAYELLPASILSHHHEDESGARHLTRVEIQGTFSVLLLQSSEGAALEIRDIEFKSVLGLEYRVTGAGVYVLYYPFPDRVPPSGLPGLQYAEMNLNINEFKNVFFSIPEMQIGRTFPPFGVGLVSFRGIDDPTKDSFGLRLYAAPSIKDVTRFFHRGDANGDGGTDISDTVYVLSFLLLGGDTPVCMDAADCNDDGQLNVADPVFLLGTLFLGQGLVPVPSPLCGLDSTDDGLDCNGQTACMSRDR